MISVCVTHQAPLIPETWFNIELCLGDYGVNSEFHVSRINSYWDSKRSVSYGAAGSNSIPNLIDQLDASADDVIRICSFRKAVVRSRNFIPGAQSIVMRFMSPQAAASTKPEQLDPTAGESFLVARPFRLEEGVFNQYRGTHKIVDLINYTSLAIDLGILK